MATKIYRKQGGVLRSWSFPVQIEKDKSIRVLFQGGAITSYSGNCTFTTNNKELQKALERHDLFNAPDGFVLEKDSDKDKDSVPVAEVADFNGAKAYILKNYNGYTQADLSTPEKVRDIAVKEGISFPNWVG
jgi:hypothetical protein